MKENTNNFCTIRQCAQSGLLTENCLRTMLKSNRLPGVWVGNRFMVNVDMLEEKLRQTSERAGVLCK